MTTSLIIIIALIASFFCLSLIGYLINQSKLKSRKNEFQDWKIGDLILFNSGSVEYAELHKLGKSYAKVLGWTENNIYIDIDGTTNKCYWSCFNANKSALWRRNYDECKLSMGKTPGFNPELANSPSSHKIDGKPIELLSEIECQVYLKNAIEQEDYDSAELIRKRMESFR